MAHQDAGLLNVSLPKLVYLLHPQINAVGNLRLGTLAKSQQVEGIDGALGSQRENVVAPMTH
jgi:hypothetical protein